MSSIKILGGICKGQSLKVPKGNHTRPTSVLLKRRVFDAHQNLQNWIFVDACAGTGAMGLEAWSRGASKVYLVEANRFVYNIMLENVEIITQNDSARARAVVSALAFVEKWVFKFEDIYKAMPQEQRERVIFFFDPPYNKTKLYHQVVLDNIIKNDWYVGRIWIESDERAGIPSNFWEKKQSFSRIYKQGSSYILLL